MSNIGVNSILSIYWEGETAWYTAKVIEKHPINFDKIRIHYLDDDMVEWASIVKMQSEGLKIIELVAPITDMERLKQRVLSSKRDRSPSKKVMESISQASPKRTKRPTASSSFSSSSTTSTTVYASGDLVEGNFKGLNTWYQCRILNIHSNTPLSYDLKYVEDGIIESNVPQAFIRPTKQQTTKASITKNVKQQPNLQFSFRYKSSVMVLPGRFSEDDRVILKHWWQQYSDKREKKYDSRTVESKSKKSNIGSAPNMSRLEESTLLTQQEIFDKFHQKMSAFTPILSTEKVSRSKPILSTEKVSRSNWNTSNSKNFTLPSSWKIAGKTGQSFISPDGTKRFRSLIRVQRYVNGTAKKQEWQPVTGKSRGLRAPPPPAATTTTTTTTATSSSSSSSSSSFSKIPTMAKPRAKKPTKLQTKTLPLLQPVQKKVDGRKKIVDPNLYGKFRQESSESDEEDEEEYETEVERRARKEKEYIKTFCKANGPKGPPNAYIIYLGAIAPSVQLEHPTLKRNELLKIIGPMWKKLSTTNNGIDAKLYVDDANERKIKYKIATGRFIHILILYNNYSKGLG